MIFFSQINGAFFVCLILKVTRYQQKHFLITDNGQIERRKKIIYFCSIWFFLDPKNKMQWTISMRSNDWKNRLINLQSNFFDDTRKLRFFCQLNAHMRYRVSKQSRRKCSTDLGAKLPILSMKMLNRLIFSHVTIWWYGVISWTCVNVNWPWFWVAIFSNSV